MQYCLKSRVMFNISHMLLCLYFKVYLSKTIANLILISLVIYNANVFVSV